MSHMVIVPGSTWNMGNGMTAIEAFGVNDVTYLLIFAFYSNIVAALVFLLASKIFSCPSRTDSIVN